MRIAVTYADGLIFQHFGHTQQFKVYEVENGAIVSSEVVDTNGSGHGALAGLLSGLHADVLICGGIGGGAQAAVADLLAGNLRYNPNVRCNHHDHHGEGHNCADHHCGGNCH